MPLESKKRFGSEKLIFWGAGATASVGFRTTDQQAQAIAKLTSQSQSCCTERCEEALRNTEEWVAPLSDLLMVLGDDTREIHHISPKAREAMGRHWSDLSSDALDSRIHDLRFKYDWPALKDVVAICPGYEQNALTIQDIFNVIDLHAQTYHGFPAFEHFLAPGRLVAARRALQLILNTLFFVDWQVALTNHKVEVEKHLGFARLLSKHHQRVGLQLAESHEYFDSRNFYLGDIAFASLNYDPLALWAQFIANREANQNPPFVGFPCTPLKIFHDFGIFMAVSTIGNQSGGTGDVDVLERWLTTHQTSN